MSDDERTGAFDHLLAAPAREALEGAAYGDWRSVSAPDAAAMHYGFPFPDSFPNEDLVAAAEAVFAAEGDRALQYGGGEYADRLLDVVVARSRERGIDCDRGAVELTNGATHALDLVCRTFLDPGDVLFVEAPTFMGALTLFRNFGVTIEGVPVDDDGLDVEALAEDLAARRAAGRPTPKLLYAIPTFQNPTGTTMPRDRRERLLELAAEYDFLVVEDDAYGDLRYRGESVPTLAELDDEGRVVHLGTFSKTVVPGVRTGWAVGHEEVVDALARANAGGTNVFTRGLLGYYCTEGDFEANLDALRQAYGRRLDHVLDWLAEHLPPGATWTDPDGGFFVWVELPEDIDADAMLPAAAEEGVTYLPGSTFYPDGGGTNALRLSVSHAPLDEMERGIRALARATRAALDGQ